MTNKIYLSTGAFIGRVNGRNYKLLNEYADRLDCDGFEVMVFADWYKNLDTVIHAFKTGAAACPVVHADKDTGDTSEGVDRSEALEMWKTNCRFAAEIGAGQIVAHMWGYPDSDRDQEYLYERCGLYREIAAGYGLDLLVENIVCRVKNPLAHFEALAGIYPGIGFVIDTRHAQFHAEAEAIFQSRVWKDGNIRHFHVSDYTGGYMDWEGFRKILQPGTGVIDFSVYFEYIKKTGFTGTLTLEAPSMREEGVDTETLNRSLNFIRRGIS